LINSLCFALLWNMVPISVTLISFFWCAESPNRRRVTKLITISYIVIAGRELTVSVAFTSISLFSMLQMPLNVIPTYVCQHYKLLGPGR
jgi:hypothetical protein